MLGEQDQLIHSSARPKRQVHGHLLLERDRELAALLDLSSAARLGVGSIALVSGEAGIGKTSLVDAFCRAAAGDLTILRGSADPLTTPRPFGPFFDMARSAGAGFSEPFHATLPHVEIFNAIHTAIGAMTPAPAIIIEDAQWADNATLDLLKFLGRRTPSLPCLLLVSYRDDEVGGDHPLAVALGALPQTRVHRLPLSPLTVDGVAALAGCDEASAGPIAELTNGNPFFVTEMRDAFDRVPASILDVFAERLSRLPGPNRDFLQCLSVAPKAISAGLLQRTFGADAMGLAAACVEKGFLVETCDGAFRFRHELARLAIYERTHRDRRQQAHARFFDALAAANDPASLDLQVHHANGAQDAVKLLQVALPAAERASVLGAHGEALAHAATALRYIDHATPDVAAPIWELWAGSACVSTSMGADLIDGRTEAARLWMLAGRRDRAAENLRWRSRLHWYRCEPAPADSVAMEAIRLLEESGRGADAAIAAALRAQLLFLKLEMQEAIAWSEKALVLARRDNNQAAEVHALNTLGAARSHLDQPEGVTRLEESLALAEAHRYGADAAHDADIARAFLNLAEHAVDFRKFDLADRVITAGVKRCTEIGFEAWVYQLHACRAEMFLDQGRLDDARVLAERVLAYPAATPRVLLRPNLVLARVASRTGAAGARAMLDNCLSLAVAAEDTGYEIAVRLAMLEHAFLQRDPATANAQLKALTAHKPHHLHTWQEGLRRVWARYFDARAGSVADMELPTCLLAELRGEVQDAIAACTGAGLSYDAALCVLRNADRKDAERLRQAIDTLCDMGAAAAVECAKAIARERNIDIRPSGSKRGAYTSTRRHPLGLTKREAEVLKFVAEGATNREISEKLHRSPRTIDQHVSSLLKKLDASSRIEVVLRVANEPWILDVAT